MRTREEVAAQLEVVRLAAWTSSEAEEVREALLWVLGETDESPGDRWREYLS